MDSPFHPEQASPSLAPVEVVTRRPPPPPRRSSAIGIVLFLLLVVALGGSMLLNFAFLVGKVGDSSAKVQEKYYSHARTGTKKVAIISLEGVILDGEGFVKQQIDQAAKDENVKAVVLRINSPGGTINGADYLYHHLRRLVDGSRIPLVVSMGGVAASGGYYAAMAVGPAPDTIFAEPTTWTGSIGVIIPHYNVVDLMKQWGIKDDSIVSHPLKDAMSMTRPMTESERQLFQALVDDAFGRFKEVVKYGRPSFDKDSSALDQVATGQIFTASQAKAAGLIDRIGFIEDAIDRAIELAGLDKDDVRVVKYKPEPSLSDVLFGSQARARRFGLTGDIDLAQLLSLTSPRAYYLCTWMPSLGQAGLTRD
jgi:protease-4